MKSSPSYFDDSRHAQALRKEALSWLGTPFREYYQEQIESARADLAATGGLATDIKGIGGGIDCIGLVQEIFYRISATQKWVFPRAPGDYQSNDLGDKVLDWLRGKSTDPQSKLLRDLFVELPIPDAVLDPDAECPRDFFIPGDILVMRHGSLFHLPVIYDDDLHFVNALPRQGVVEGTIQDSSYSSHLAAVFRLRPKSSTDENTP